jgi:hypothetical protein
MLVNTDSKTLVTKCSRPSCSKVSRSVGNEAKLKPALAIFRSSGVSQVSSLGGFCFGERWYCSGECLEWGLGQEVLQRFRQSEEEAILSRPRIGTILLVRGWITSDQVRIALEHQSRHGDKLGRWLVKLGYISQEKLIIALSQQLQIPWMVEGQLTLDDSATSLLPKMLCHRFNVFPLKYTQKDQLTLAVDYCFTDELIQAVSAVVDYEVQPFLTKSEVLGGLIREYVRSEESSTTDLIRNHDNLASEAGYHFVKRWFDFQAERARFGLFENTLWVRYITGDGSRDHFIFFEHPKTPPQTPSSSPD